VIGFTPDLSVSGLDIVKSSATKPISKIIGIFVGVEQACWKTFTQEMLISLAIAPWMCARSMRHLRKQVLNMRDCGAACMAAAVFEMI
jgi:hypothetical protein